MGGSIVDRDIVLFSGYARLPSGTASSEVYGVMALVVLVDMQNGTIVEAECTLSTRVSERFVARVLVGKNLQSDLPEIVEVISQIYQGTAKKAIITALRIISDRYLAFVAGRNASL